MASDLLGDIYDRIRLADTHILSVGTVINETVINKLNQSIFQLDQLPSTISSNVKQIVKSNSDEMEVILNQMSADINRLSIDIGSLNTDVTALIETSFNDLFDKLDSATDKITKYQEQLEDLLSNSIEALNQKLDDNHEAILDQFDAIQIFLRDRFGELTEYVGILHNAMKDYVKEQTKEVIGEIEASETRLKSSISESTTKIIENAMKNMEEIKTTITTGFETMVEELHNMTDDILASISNLWLDIKKYLDSVFNESPENLLKRIQLQYAVVNQFSKGFKHPDNIEVEFLSPEVEG